ncbi:unnamed protein product (macronuclear) [Paramecium tetraurelia]|uniref:Uncharacterized protein n=1 Tax=Paramecium tetraurelia TaxID=5888 RepID=A0D5V1_PARTE|nr:uncharacterized protein GSPATT00013848001 [Paramecium tetraurelia]CAK78418.1 unnamed protein product [Paramecium tetraurelia]|eukprot:XP_001445815.1 hypothetical protein (macronuclear) [Paramecium tetraurelia strain d4-2]
MNLETTNEGGIFIANSNGWDDNSKQFMLKIQKEMKEDEKVFISQLMRYQRNYENGNDQHQVPTNILKLYDYFQWQSSHCIVMEVGQESLLEYIDLSNADSKKNQKAF